MADDLAPDFDPDADNPFIAAAAAARGSDAGPSLGQRFLLNVEAGAAGTLAGRGLRAAVQRDDANDTVRQTAGDLLAKDAQFKAMRGFEGPLEGAAALAGQLVGGFSSPESFITRIPGVTNLIEAGAGRLVGALGGRIAGAAGTQAAVAGATDVAGQAAELKAGLRDHYDLSETGIHAGMGALIGGGLHTVGEIAGAGHAPTAKPTPERIQELQAASERAAAGDQSAVPEVQAAAAETGLTASADAPDTGPMEITVRPSGAEVAPVDPGAVAATEPPAAGASSASEPEVTAPGPASVPNRYSPPDPLDLAMSGQLSGERAYAISDEVRAGNQSDEEAILGDRVKEWRKLQREQNSFDDKKASAATDRIQEIESTLPKEDVDRLYGVGTERTDPEEWHGLSQELIGVEASRPEAVETIARAAKDLPKANDWSAMTPAEWKSTLVILHGMGEEVKRGGDPKALLREAFEERFVRDGAQGNAAELARDNAERLSRLLKDGITGGGERGADVAAATGTRALPAPEPQAARGVRDETVSSGQGGERPGQAGDPAGPGAVVQGAEPGARGVQPEGGVGRPDGPLARRAGGQEIDTGPITAPTPETTDIISPATAMRRLADRLDAWVSDRKVKFRDAEAEYDPKQATIRLRNIAKVDAFIHEIGHHVEFRAGEGLQALVDDNLPGIVHLVPADTRALDLRPGELQAEAFAEFMARYVLAEDAGRSQAPQFFDQFTTFMRENHPEILASVNDFRQSYRDWKAAPSGRQVASTIVRPEVMAAGAARQSGNPMERGALGLFFTRLRRTFVDKNEPLNEMVRAAAKAEGKAIPSIEDPRVLITRAQYAAVQSTENDYAIGIGGRPHEAEINGTKVHFAPKDIVDGFTTDPRTGLFDDVRAEAADSYLLSRHALALIKEVNEGLHTRMPDQFKEVDHQLNYDALKAQYPEFEQLGEMLSVVHRDGVLRDFAEHLLTAEERDARLANHTYVPLQRDMRLNDSSAISGGGGASQASSRLGQALTKRRIGSDRNVISPLATFIQQMHESNALIRQNDAMLAIIQTSERLGTNTIGERLTGPAGSSSQVDIVAALKAYIKQQDIPAEDGARLLSMAQDTVNGSSSMVSLFKAEKMGPGNTFGRIIFARENGKVVPFALRDTEFARGVHEAVNQVGKPVVDMISTSAANVGQVLRVGATGAPTFAVANTVVDALTRALTDARMGRTGTALDFIPAMPMVTELGRSIREAVSTVMDEAIEKTRAVSHAIGYEIPERAHSYADLERGMLKREGLIGATQMQTVRNIANATVDPLKTLEIPGDNISTRPLAALLQSAWRGAMSDKANGVAENMSQSMRFLRRISEEKYGADAPALGLRMAKDIAWDGVKLSTLDPLKAAFGAWKYIAEVSEPAGRFAAARGVLKYELRGSGVSQVEFRAFLKDADAVSPEVAGKIQSALWEAVTAANGTADFQRSGTLSLGIAKQAMFLNANLQGLSAHFDTVKTILGGAVVTPKQAAIVANRPYLLWQLSAIGTASGLMAYMKAQSGDSRVSNTLDWKAMSNWVIPITDEYNFTMRKPYEWRSYINSIEAAATYLGGRGDLAGAGRKVLASLYDGLTPPNPYSMGPVSDVTNAIRSNYDSFRKTPIVPEAMQKRSARYQYDERTTEAAKMATGIFNSLFEAVGAEDMSNKTKGEFTQAFFSPKMADYVMKTMLSSMYTDFRGVADVVTGKPFDPSTSPIARAFVAKSNVYGQARVDAAENVGRHGGMLESQLANYNFLLKNTEGPAGANAFYSGLDQNQRDYVAMMAPDRRSEGAGVKRLHPLERTKALSSAIIPLSQMVDQGTVYSTDKPNKDGFTISDPSQRMALRDTLGRIQEMEMTNALILTGDKGYIGVPYRTEEVKALYSKLNEIDPRVYKELSSRYATERVVKFDNLYDPSTGKGVWPDIQQAFADKGAKADLSRYSAASQRGGFELSGQRARKVTIKAAPQFLPATPAEATP